MLILWDPKTSDIFSNNVKIFVYFLNSSLIWKKSFSLDSHLKQVLATLACDLDPTYRAIGYNLQSQGASTMLQLSSGDNKPWWQFQVLAPAHLRPKLGVSGPVLENTADFWSRQCAKKLAQLNSVIKSWCHIIMEITVSEPDTTLYSGHEKEIEARN